MSLEVQHLAACAIQIEEFNRTALATQAKLELVRTAQMVNKEHNV